MPSVNKQVLAAGWSEVKLTAEKDDLVLQLNG